jgi:hypothetical protein
VPSPGLLTSWEKVQEFALAGNATFTLVSRETGARYTYKLTNKKSEPDVFFAKVLSGPDNTSDYRYMGAVHRTALELIHTTRSQVSDMAKSFQALDWFFRMWRVKSPVLGEKLEVWHEGRCGRCGRKLTVPESLAAGLGPECAGRAYA